MIVQEFQKPKDNERKTAKTNATKREESTQKGKEIKKRFGKKENEQGKNGKKLTQNREKKITLNKPGKQKNKENDVIKK